MSKPAANVRKFPFLEFSPSVSMPDKLGRRIKPPLRIIHYYGHCRQGGSRLQEPIARHPLVLKAEKALGSSKRLSVREKVHDC